MTTAQPKQRFGPGSVDDKPNNIIEMTDSYKLSHWRQYPPGTQHVYSYQEARKGRHEEIVFFGLQYYLMRYMQGPVVNMEMVREARELSDAHVGKGVFNYDGWAHIASDLGGYLPLRINAVPEGTIVPLGTPLWTMENTDPSVPWLTNWMETLLSKTWAPTTVATQGRAIRKVFEHYLGVTGSPESLPFKLQDFGYRGVSSEESAGILGAAHLINSWGTDTIAALRVVMDYYNPGRKGVAEAMPGFSIPASEHSTITSWGREHEADAYENMLDQYPDGLLACVSDSYDIQNAIEELWGKQLRDKVLARNGTLVIRPDSPWRPGDSVAVTVLKAVKAAAVAFGSEKNEKGYQVLNPKVRIIQGDGVDIDAIRDTLGLLAVNGWSADNVAFGMGGALLQKLDRDTLSFAIKCSDVTINGEHRDVFKSPAGAVKASKAGRFEGHPTLDYGLETVFEDGFITRIQSFDNVRERAAMIP